MNVLIVDDESSQRTGLAGMVKAWGMIAETASDGQSAMEKLETFHADVIVTDMNMPGIDGFGLLRMLREAGDMPPVIVVTAFGNVETAVRTVHELGAFWYVEKPLQPNVLQVLIRRAAAQSGLRQEKKVLERQLQYKGTVGEMVGSSAKMQEIFSLLQQAAPSKACVLISGESGTGKELVARTIHALSPRRSGPFVAINCAALPETLIESELFGHEKGSFTGATERRAGCFELAQHGTLLLDEIGEMPMPTQAKLLRILEDSKVRRLGGKTEFEVDVRLVAATNKVPDEAVRGGHLREDLFYRLNVFHIHLPPLRDRKDDVLSIAESLIQDLNKKHDTRVVDLSPEVVEALQRHDWPGNVRELRNALERAVILAGAGTIQLQHLPVNLQSKAASVAVPAAFAASAGAAASTPAEAPAAPAPAAAPALASAAPQSGFGSAAQPAAQPDSAAQPVSASAPNAAESDDLRVPIGTTVEEAEKNLILRTLEHTRNNKTRAAEVLGISLKTLHNKLKEYGARDTA